MNYHKELELCNYIGGYVQNLQGEPEFGETQGEPMFQFKGHQAGRANVANKVQKPPSG